MIPYKLDYSIEKVLENKNLQKQIESNSFTKTIQDHKWLLSEKLGRDVDFFVTIIDYFINIQKLPTTPKTVN